MFCSEYQYSLDPKGRLFIPAKFRAVLGEKFIVTKGLDKCLFVYTEAEWQKIEENLRELPFTKADARAFSRLFFSGAVECTPDKQGRIVLPVNLRAHAELKDEVVIIGVSNRVEIWSKENWEGYRTEATNNYEKLAENLFS